MKKLMMFVMAAVFAAAFASGAYAAESAQLGLQVTFAVDQDLQRLEELKTHVGVMAEKNKAKFHEIYVDRNNDGVVDGRDLDLNGDGRIDDVDFAILREAIVYLSELQKFTEDNIHELKSILERRPDLQYQIVPVIDFANQVISDIVRNAKTLSSLNQRVISIELNENAWKLDGVKLGEKRSNQDPTGAPMHAVKNTGNVSVLVAIGYGPQVYTDVIGQIRPGIEPGVDTFATYAASFHDGREMGGMIPPVENRKLLNLGKEEAQPFVLVYYSPTQLSVDAKGMSTTYELKAYPALIVDPPIAITN